ncbi:hypothetical protein AgCh_019136 [Apium graveolens]
MLQYTSPPTPPYLVHPLEPPPLPPPHQFYTASCAPANPATLVPVSSVTRTFLHQMDSKISQLDNKINQVTTLIEGKTRVTNLLNLFKDEGTVTTCEVLVPGPVDNVWRKMEERMTQITHIPEKMGKSCETSSEMINENILEIKVEADMPEVVKEDVLGIVEDDKKSTLAKETYSNTPNLLPAIFAHHVFDENSKIIYFQNVPITTSQEGSLRRIDATILEENRKYVEQDVAAERRFQQVYVIEPCVLDTINIPQGLKDRFEGHHGVRIQERALANAAQLSSRYITGKHFSDNTIDLIDEICANVQPGSQPEEIDNVESTRMQLKIELHALEKEKD